MISKIIAFLSNVKSGQTPPGAKAVRPQHGSQAAKERAPRQTQGNADQEALSLEPRA